MIAGVLSSLETRSHPVSLVLITALGFGGYACSLLRCGGISASAAHGMEASVCSLLCCEDACCLPLHLVHWQHLCVHAR